MFYPWPTIKFFLMVGFFLIYYNYVAYIVSSSYLGTNFIKRKELKIMFTRILNVVIDRVFVELIQIAFEVIGKFLDYVLQEA